MASALLLADRIGCMHVVGRAATGFAARRQVEPAATQLVLDDVGCREVLIVRRCAARLRTGLQAQVRAQLAQARQTAARPGPDAHGAAAVLFDSPEELLLLLALALARGDRAAWYWREVARLLPEAALHSTGSLLIAAARELPAVLRAAAARGVLHELAGACSEPDAALALRALAVEHGLPELLTAAAGSSVPARPAAAAAEPARPRPLPHGAGGARSPADPARGPAVYGDERSVSALTGRVQHALAPLIGRDAAAALAAAPPAVRLLFAAALSVAGAPAATTPLREVIAAALRGELPAAVRGEVSRAGGAETRAVDAAAAARADAPPAAAGTARALPPPAPSAALTAPRSATTAAGTQREPTGAASPPGPADDAPLLPHGALHTRLAGLFFLLNLLDARAAAAAAREYGGWRVFADVCLRVGRAHAADDALWPWLCALTDGVPPLPHARASQLAAGCARTVRRRAGRGARPVWRELPLRPAVLHATNTHIDLVLPLAEAGLAVRRAGLDLDPGWVPWLGRVVTFHYD